jgi:hypothetical protein
MSEQRVSARVLENERRLKQEAERAESHALDDVNKAVASFFGCLNGATCSLTDFELPQEWTRETAPNKHRKATEDSDEEEHSVVRKPDVIKYSGPPFRKLRQNLYKPPLQRSIVPAEDCPSCDCTPSTGCGPQCHNRNVYM